MNNLSQLPDGNTFPFWDDETSYTRIYHVANQHPMATDDGEGRAERPFLTINRAAQLVQPGEKVVVHGGVYRECVQPARGGTGKNQMIAYEAAAGETVTIVASERLETPFSPSTSWNFGGATVWQAELPADWFRAYNPFAIDNFTMEYSSFVPNWSTEENHRLLLKRGMVFVDERPLQQVLHPQQLGQQDGAFWVEAPGLRIHVRLWDDANPNEIGAAYEISVREQCFAPPTRDVHYLRLSGFHFRYAADGPPIPQRSMVSSNDGHRWIIEDCDLRWANACAIDVGYGSWHRREFQEGYTQPAAAGLPPTDLQSGHHIIRRNQIADCGIGGIAAVGNNLYTLIEDNVIERVARIDIERLWETAAIKLHVSYGALIRGNVLRHIRSATVVWLDYMINNSRITNNLVYDVESLHGGLMIEASDQPNWIDHNVIWDVRGVEDIWDSTSGVSGPGINIDTAENCLIAHNFLGNIPDEFAISVHLAQEDRIIMGRTMMGTGHQVLNNLLVNCPKRVLFTRAAGNVADGNLYAAQDDWTSLLVEQPQPAALLNLAAWQRHFGFDENGRQLPITAEFDPDTHQLTLTFLEELPGGTAVPPTLTEQKTAEHSPGPWPLQIGEQIFQSSPHFSVKFCALPV